MIKRVVSLVVFVPLAIVLIVLSVANRQIVTLALNPFKPDDALLSLSAPFFVFLFLSLILGLLLGSAATWLAQGKHRKKARAESRQVVRWQAEADRHKSRAEQLAGSSQPQISAK
ncbi:MULTISPECIES: lipopolysaccharide assembly protein LapA domain-containing protein [Alphaproteobacteria]|uniref:Membrane protein n=2 Tax=Alphaproteobacteria TaxID=28211 RepID=A0A512HDX6_9HYPH|nr:MULTISPECIES: lipopolysaccharide assembly protein LapA domain-containing protein [Alphaproteobacteria]GEO83649.1 membrane protein [Ciceribacter naphthalenivorans]GLR24199.1 membrane protein [Ciceribacter naphthalenivorans]GLT07055.1 membrane protein [Sphingomonas psychrolutea]